jgi:hypothetical protein
MCVYGCALVGIGAVAFDGAGRTRASIEAALYWVPSPLAKGALLTDEAGFDKTIEARLVIDRCGAA